MNASLIIRALMNAGFEYREAVEQANTTLESDSRVAIIRLAACCVASPKPVRKTFGRRVLGGINRF